MKYLFTNTPISDLLIRLNMRLVNVIDYIVASIPGGVSLENMIRFAKM